MSKPPKSPINKVRLPEPQNEVEFEELVLEIAKIRFNSSHFQLYGRRGQNQHGIDVTGFENDKNNRKVVLQAKCFDPKSKYEAGSIRKHVQMAVKHGIAFKTFVWATTLPQSKVMQDEADEVRGELVRDGYDTDTSVIVWSWQELTSFAHENPTIRHLIIGNLVTAGSDQVPLSTIEEHKPTGSITPIAAEQIQQLADIAKIVADFATDGRHAALWDTLSKQSSKKPRQTLNLVERTLEESENFEDADFARAKGIIGNCKLSMNLPSEAAPLYFEAYRHAPTRAASVANYALGLGITEQIEELREFYLKNVSKNDGPNAQLVKIALHFLEDPSIVPEACKAEDVIRLEILLLQREDLDPEKMVSELRELFAKNPDNIRFKESLASVLLDRAISNDKGVSSEDLGPERREYVLESENLYRELWEEVSGAEYEDFLLDISIPHNFAVTLRVNGKIAEAIEVLSRATGLRPESPALSLQYGICLLENDTPVPERVISALDESIDALRVKMRNSITRMKWDDVLVQIDAIRAHEDNIDTGFLDGIKHIAEVNQLSGADQTSYLEGVLTKESESVRELVMLIQLARRFEMFEYEGALYDRAVSLFKETDSFIVRIALAHEARNQDDYDLIFRLLEDHIDYERNSEQLQLLCEVAASEYPTRDRDQRVFDGLGERLKALPRYAFYEAAYYERAGRFEESRRLWARLFDETRSLRSWLGLWRTSDKLHDSNRIRHLLRHDDLVNLNGSLLERLDLAHVLLLSGRETEAVSIAERVIKSPAALQSRDVTARFSMFFLGRNIAIPQTDTVAEKSFVRLQDQFGKTVEGVIGGDKDYRWGVSLSDESRIVRESIGLKKGNTFKIENAVQSVEWTVEEVQSELLRIIQFIPSVHEMDFGDDALIYSMSMPDEDVSGVIDIVRRGEERRNRLISAILERGVPIVFAAEANQTGPLSIAGAIEISGRDFPTSTGFANIFEQSLRIAKAVQNGVVIDIVTVQTAMRLGILEDLAARYGPLRLPSHSLEEMRSKVLELKFSSQERMTLTAKDGQVYRDVLEKDEIADLAGQLEKDISYIEEHCLVENVVFQDTENEAFLHLMTSAPSTASLMSLAARHDIPILSEDGYLRSWVKGITGKDGFWLNPALRVLRNEASLQNDRFLSALAGLSQLRHRHVSLDGQILCEAFDLTTGQEISAEYIQLCEELGGENADIQSHCNVALFTLRHLLKDTKNDLTNRQAASHLLTSLLEGARGERLKDFLAQMFIDSAGYVRSYIRDYMIGHFYIHLFKGADED